MKKQFSYLVLLILNCFVCIVTAFSQPASMPRYTFGALTATNGLPINYVDDIFKDSKGFFWISTRGGGLCRYDGYECLNFNVNSKLLSLKSNFVTKVCEDRFSRLWLATDFGLDIINLKSLSKAATDSYGEVFAALAKKEWNNLLLDKQGNVWIQNSNEVHKLSFDSKGDLRSISSTKSSFNMPGVFSCIQEIGKDVYAGHNGRLVVLEELASVKQLQIKEIAPSLNLGVDLFISSLVEMNGDLWIGTEDGLVHYDPISKAVKWFSNIPDNRNSLTQNMVTSLEKLGDNMLVVGTLKGLNFFNTRTLQVDRVTQDSHPTALNSNFVNCLFVDGANLWVGTESGGINKFFQPRLDVENFSHTGSERSLSPNPVNAILEDRKGNLWVGTVEGGLNLKKEGEEFFTHIKSGTHSITHNSVSALAEDDHNRLWIGTWGGGISILNLSALPSRIFSYLPTDIDYISLLKYDTVNDGMWIGTNKAILFYDNKSEKISRPIEEKLTKGIRGTLGCIIDRENRLWIGTTNGVYIVELSSLNKDRSACHTRLLEGEKVGLNRLFLHNVTSILEASDGSIWIGSNGYGVCRLIHQNGDYLAKVYTTADGLANNASVSILEDDNGLVWISTSNGISCFNTDSQQFVNYTDDDGLSNVQFYWNAAFQSKQNGKLYFGHLKGFSVLKTTKVYPADESNKVLFTKLNVLNNMVNAVEGNYAATDIVYAKQIDLHESDKSFSVEFSSLNYSYAGATGYAYRLLGFDSTWVNVPADLRFAAYTNLSPGTYTLEVRYKKSNGDWSPAVSSLKIVVHPYFYKTVWFISLVIILLASGIVQFFRWRFRDLKRQRQVLHETVEQRTYQLAQQKSLLEQQANELTIQNRTLFEQNTKISLQQKELVSMSQKVQEAMADRLSFFTNITHEFRTPITLINGPIERALKLCTDDQVREQLNFASRNSSNLLSLVNQILDFRKIESDTVEIDNKPDNLRYFFNEIVDQFKQYAQERGIVICPYIHLHNDVFSFDKEALRKVLTNLLANAVKFSPDDGKIAVYLASRKLPCAGITQCYLAVSDNGVGLQEKDLDQIFDRFYQSKFSQAGIGQQTGTGIGLYLVKRIISLMGGHIFARNNKGAGASFRVLISLQEADSIDDASSLTQSPVEQKESMDVLKTEGASKKKSTILLVEDNSDMRRYLKTILENDYHVFEAEHGQEALDVLRQEDIDFVVSDLMMPVMDGLQLSKVLKQDMALSHIPVLLLTAKTGKQVQLDSYRGGVDEVLFKPFDEEILLSRIQSIMTIRRNYQQRFSLEMNVDELNIPVESKDSQFLRRAIELVKANYKNPNYEIVSFIRDLGVSKTLANSKLQHLTGQSPSSFIRNYRLTVAKETLLQTQGSMSIAQVAYEVGFNDPKYFTRCFTKLYQISPSDFLSSKSNSGIAH